MAQILVVDDEVGIRELLSEILSDEALVQLAENATAAARARAGRPISCCSIWMPDRRSPFEGMAPEASSPCRYQMSGHGPSRTAWRRPRSAHGFLEKPIALQKLLATVKARCARASHVRRCRQHREFRPLRGDHELRSAWRNLRRRRGGAHAREKGVMPELYRVTSAAQRALDRCGARAQRGVQDLLQQVSSGVLFVGNLRCCPKTSRSTSRFSRPAEKSNVRLVLYRGGAEAPCESLATRLDQAARAAFHRRLGPGKAPAARLLFPRGREKREVLCWFLDRAQVPARTSTPRNLLRRSGPSLARCARIDPGRWALQVSA